jgi:hypothetical protein
MIVVFVRARKETTMDAIQRSELNNQTNNGANEKWTPGAKGNTKDDGKPLDHTYPQGHGVQQAGNQAQGNMQSQMSGGSGPVQGITDSHQRQMEQKSAAYGMLEQPVGHRPKDSGTNLNEMRDMHRDEVRGTLGSQNAQQPDLQGGSIGARGGNLQMSTQGGGMYGPDTKVAPSAQSGSMGNRQSGQPAHAGGTQGGGMAGPQGGAGGALGTGHGNGQEAQRGNTQLGVAGSHMASNQHSDAGGVHQSNDVAGGLPRSPGNAGADHAASYDRTGSQTGPGGAEAGPPVHESNDAAGGYPRSPGGANRLSGSDNMDDDTGFKRK